MVVIFYTDKSPKQRHKKKEDKPLFCGEPEMLPAMKNPASGSQSTTDISEEKI